METKPRFDLNTALQSWREELAAQPGLNSDQKRELESHLLDTIADLRQRGLNPEEAFWLGCRRLGPPQELSREFTKANPATVWRERLFWAALIMLAVQLWSLTFGTLSTAIISYRELLPEWVLFYIPVGVQHQWLRVTLVCAGGFLYFLPFLYAFISLGRHPSNSGTRALEYALSSKRRLLSLAGVLYLLLATVSIFINAKALGAWPFPRLVLFTSPFHTLGLIALTCWLMPSRSETDAATVEG